MKRIIPVAILSVMILAGCGQEEKKKLAASEEQNAELTSELQATLATQDSLFALINDITDGMNQIKELEHIISTPSGIAGENESRKAQLRNDMVAIQQALQQRRERLAQLEAQVKKSNGENSTLLRTIDNLKAQIADQETEITSLTNELAAANVKIANLNSAVDSLSTSVASEKIEREQAEQQAAALNQELNTCYYAIGTKGELKKNKIIESGFLRKTKILESDFEKSYFTVGDKTTLLSIPLHSNKAKVLTNQPKDSYEIFDNNGQKVLKITDPTKFWSLSNYLVVQVD
ncbi:MAG: hypothetical protein LIO90_11920 [Bacteroidales bacterium]|nr:hypothetical protein [Bacteroidales bacterium]